MSIQLRYAGYTDWKNEVQRVKNFVGLFLFFFLFLNQVQGFCSGREQSCEEIDATLGATQKSWQSHLERLREFIVEARRTISDVKTIRVGATEYRVAAFLGGGNEGRVYEVEDETNETGRAIVKQYYPPPNSEPFREAYMVWSLGRSLAAQISEIPTVLRNVSDLNWGNLTDRFPFIRRRGNTIHAVSPARLSPLELGKMPDIDWKNLTAKFENHYAISVEDVLSNEIYTGNGDEKKVIPEEFRVPECVRHEIAAAYQEWKRKYCEGRFNPSKFNSGDHGNFVGREADVLIELWPPYRMYLGDD